MTMSGHTATEHNLKTAVEKSLGSDQVRHKVKTVLKTCLQGLSFIRKGLKLQVSDPSYKLRYLYALNFWRKETGNSVISRTEANDLIIKLKKELNSKDCVYSEDEDFNVIVDDFFSKESLGKGRREKEESSTNRSNEKSVWYVTSKCDNAFFVKSLNKAEDEERINIKEIVCDYKLICPGDEAQVIRDNETMQLRVNITKCKGLDRSEISGEKARFIADLLMIFLQDESGLTVVEILRTRSQGIWNYIKHDEELFKDVQCVKNLLELSFDLSQELSKISKESCKWFMEDLSSSKFFTAVLPAFIQNHDKESNGYDDIKRLKTLLELMMEFSPHTASKILDVAKHLVDVMHTDSIGGNLPDENLKCNAIEYLVHLGEILAKSVTGFEDDDTSDCVSTPCYRSVTRDEKAKFITDLLTLLLEGESALIIVHKLRTSSENIWKRIKNDKELFQNDDCVKNLIRLSSELSQELSKKSKISCKWFLEDLSSSSFFTAVLPIFIDQNHNRDLNRGEDINRLKSLLELMMEFSPHTATKVLDVAKHLADIMHTKSTGENSTEENSKSGGVEYIIRLEKILSKSVSGCQDVDTTSCRWNELPTIPTKKEIFSAFDLRSLEAIKENEPYESIQEYLDINYRLLREECFRDLCTGIQDFLERKGYDAQKMKMYRIKLHTINASKSQTLVLNCEDYYQDENNDSPEEHVDTSDTILYGSLMCISLDKEFESLIWAAVVECEPQRDSNIKLVSVRLCSDRNMIKNIDVLLELIKITNKGDYALMAESPTFYNAFGPCMDRLKKTYQNGDMPLVDELVFAKKSHLPNYTHDKEQKCDWSIIFDKPTGYDFTFPEDRKLSPIEQYKYLNDTAELSPLLDETQKLAVENFLQNRVSIIQGPPGTGKSFLGLKILRLMLSMEIHKRFDGPILIMTYKNFALDHFLEACLEYAPKIVRIGKETNETLSKINLRNVRHEKGINRKLLAMEKEATTNMRTAQSELKGLFKCLSSKTLTVQLFLKVASKVHIHSLLTMSNDLDQNIDDVTADRLLRKWEQKCVPKELEEHLIGSLKRWLPKTKMQERYQDKGADSDYHEKSRFSPSSTNADDDEEDSVDSKVLNKDRQLDAMEEDDIHANDGEPEDSMTDDVKIPFFYTSDIGLNEDFEEDLNLWTLSDDERVDFICSLQRKIVREFSKAVSLYEDNAKCRKDIWNAHTVSILKEYDVIGMTVSGAATRLHLLDQLKPCAVIVEEAAEIIEGQLVSVLPPSIKHLVMLGDQEQLKPRINCYQLKKKKHLDCSMFERLINNDMNYTQLGQQCRMRDDIADLLRELKIYKDLKTNHEKTRDNKPPDYIESSLYFVKHTMHESKLSGSNSLYNLKEISLILDVAEKLMKNGYPPCDVTVLCPYRGQMIKMKSAFERKSSDPSEEYFNKLKDINITTVDSFQGEERKVILLSLVRSNAEQKIGFLAVRNRICVAISRAQCGLYIFGNSSVYQTSQNWKKIIDLLTQKRKVGWFIPFKKVDDNIKLDVPKEYIDILLDTGHKNIERIETKTSTKVIIPPFEAQNEDTVQLKITGMLRNCAEAKARIRQCIAFEKQKKLTNEFGGDNHFLCFTSENENETFRLKPCDSAAPILEDFIQQQRYRIETELDNDYIEGEISEKTISNMKDQLMAVLQNLNTLKEEKQVLADLWCQFGKAVVSCIDEELIPNIFTQPEIKRRIKKLASQTTPRNKEKEDHWMVSFVEGIDTEAINNVSLVLPKSGERNHEFFGLKLVNTRWRYEFGFLTPTCRRIRLKVWETLPPGSDEPPVYVKNILRRVFLQGKQDIYAWLCYPSTSVFRGEIMTPNAPYDCRIKLRAGSRHVTVKDSIGLKEGDILSEYLSNCKLDRANHCLRLPDESEHDIPEDFDCVFYRQSKETIYEATVDEESFTVTVLDDNGWDSDSTERVQKQQFGIRVVMNSWSEVMLSPEQHWEPEEIVQKLEDYISFLSLIQNYLFGPGFVTKFDSQGKTRNNEFDTTDNENAIYDTSEYSCPVVKVNGKTSETCSFTIGPKGGCFSLPLASSFLLFPPHVVEDDVTLTCHRIRHRECEVKPNNGEAFVSRILKIEPKGVKFKKAVTVLLSHCASEHQDVTNYYELVVADLSRTDRQDLKTERISFIEDVPKSISNKEIIDDSLPLAKASILETCTVVAVTRAKLDQISIRPNESVNTFTQQYGDSAELIIAFPSGITKEIQELTVQLLPADVVLKNEIPFGRNIVCCPVIKVSGQRTPFLEAVNVELTYSNTKFTEMTEEFLPVQNKIKFAPKFGVLFHSNEESKPSWQTLNEIDDVFIERSRIDQVKFSFPVNHFSWFCAIMKTCYDAIASPLRCLQLDDRQPPHSAIVLAVHNISSHPKTLHAVLAPKQAKVDFKIDGIYNFMKPLQPYEEISFCVPIGGSHHLPLEDNALWFDPDGVCHLQSNTNDDTDLSGKYMHFLKDKTCNSVENRDINLHEDHHAKALIHISEAGSFYENVEPGIRHKQDTPSWKWERVSKVHHEKLKELRKLARTHSKKIKEINGVRVCCLKEFLIGKGSDGTRVYVGLGKDGVEKAVKRLPRDACSNLAEQEKTVLNQLNTKQSKYVVNYWFLEEQSDQENLFLILDLCEETLENFVKHSSEKHLVKSAPDIIKQVLKGLVDLHCDPNPILHRDLKPSNILRNIEGNWLLADFGISRILTEDVTTHMSTSRGTEDWKAVESCSFEGMTDDGNSSNVRYKKESDIQVAGMVAFYILTQGKHPFGEKPDRLRNLLNGNPVYLVKLKDDSAKDLISWMLEKDPKKRPSAKEALKHPYLQPAKQKFELLCKVGNQTEIKKGDAKSIVVQNLNNNPTDWKTLLPSDVLKYLCSAYINGKAKVFRYKSSWTECLRLIRNVNQHWHDQIRPQPQPEAFYLVGDPQEYFLELFPSLPVDVHRIIRSCDWKERGDLREYFM